MTTFPSYQLCELAAVLREARPDVEAAVLALQADVDAAVVDIATESRITRRIGDWTVREALPAMLCEHGHEDVSAALKALTPIVDKRSAVAAAQAMFGPILKALGADGCGAAWEAYQHAAGMLHDVAGAGLDALSSYDPERYAHVASGAAEVASRAPSSRPIELLTELLVMAEARARS